MTIDKLFETGLTTISVTIALAGAKKMGVEMNSLHLDSSSFHVDGEYRDRETEENGTAAITITQSYSRDHRPDLKQFIVDLMCTGDGDVSLYLRVADGNESERAIFARLIREFNQEWDIDTLFVADAALYSTENLEQMKSLRWLSRVPATIKQTQELLTLDSSIFQDSEIKGYRIAEVGNYYGKIKQRWLIVESEARRLSDLKQLEKRVSQHLASAQSQLKQLSQQRFACEADALKAANRFETQLTFHQLDGLQIFPELSYAQAADQTIPNQLGKPTSTPTLRWVFQCFMSVHLITFAGIKQISNLTSERSHILQFLHSSCRQYYLLS
jgi:transposase